MTLRVTTKDEKAGAAQRSFNTLWQSSQERDKRQRRHLRSKALCE
jgi:hypothetical protein